MRFCIASAALGPGPGGGSPSVPHLAPAWHRSLAILVYFCVLQMSKTRSSQVAPVWAAGSWSALSACMPLAWDATLVPWSCPGQALVGAGGGPHACHGERLHDSTTVLNRDEKPQGSLPPLPEAIPFPPPAAASASAPTLNGRLTAPRWLVGSHWLSSPPHPSPRPSPADVLDLLLAWRRGPLGETHVHAHLQWSVNARGETTRASRGRERITE